MTDDKELTTEEKAAAIGGKEVVAEPEEKIPDYDVTEDTGEDTEKEEKEEDDKPLGKSREDHKQLSNREKRQLRKKRLAEKFDAKDAIIKQQAQQLNDLAARLNDVDGKLSQVDQESLQRAWNETQAQFQAAEQEHASAFSTGDGAKATLAMRKMYDAQKRLDELQAINARNQNVQPKQQSNKQDAVVVNRAKEWAEKNTWFKNGGSDDDSAIADAIASKLVKEGYDPRSDDYWDELDDRLSQKGIGSQEDEEDQTQSQRERQEEDIKPAKRRSPPINGGGGRGDFGAGKTAITLPTAYIQTLKDNGYWEDKPTRDRMIKRYLEGIKQRESEGRR